MNVVLKVNKGTAVEKVRKDRILRTPKPAFLAGPSTGLKQRTFEVRVLPG
jgi:hypothetical protein